MSELDSGVRSTLVELAPALRRAADLDPASMARLRLGSATASVLIRLPFDVLASRTVTVERSGEPVDAAVRTGELLSWLDDERQPPPRSRDADWRSGQPPAARWQRLDTVPDNVVRELVRAGARALEQAGADEGVAGAQPRSATVDALLNAVVLTVTGEANRLSAPITLRLLSALVRMGFLPHGSHIAVDLAGRWMRIAAAYGSVYAERPGLGLGVLIR